MWSWLHYYFMMKSQLFYMVKVRLFCWWCCSCCIVLLTLCIIILQACHNHNKIAPCGMITVFLTELNWTELNWVLLKHQSYCASLYLNPGQNRRGIGTAWGQWWWWSWSWRSRQSAEGEKPWWAAEACVSTLGSKRHQQSPGISYSKWTVGLPGTQCTVNTQSKVLKALRTHMRYLMYCEHT